VAARKKRSQRINPDNKLKNPLMWVFSFYTMKKIFFLSFSIAIIASCGKDDNRGKLTPTCDGSHPTYENEIKPILDTKCGSGSCHPNYTSYNGLNSIIQNGQFKREVLTNQTMPQNSSLTHEQINKIQCWVNDGYPEN
jgi:hypothetical protein